MTAQLDLLLGAPPSDLVGRLRAFGLPANVDVALHSNRRVMISVDRSGDLRVHRGYGHAPDRIVAALARWATRRPRLSQRDRRALARIVLGFPVHDHAPPTRPRQRRPEPNEPGDAARLARLGALHSALNARWFASSLGAIEIRLSGRMRRRLGHYEPRSEGVPAIVISRRHLSRNGWASATDTLLHEMVHQWQDETGLPLNHGAGFRQKAREVGIAPRAWAQSPS